MDSPPEVSVVMATHDRPDQLLRQITALREQTLNDDRYELVVVDDGSGPETVAALRALERDGGGPALRVVRREAAGGPAAARNAGWRVARAPVVAFTDDDCRATPGWLEAALGSLGGREDAFVAGPILPMPEEFGRMTPFHYTMQVEKLGPGFETANVVYPRGLLERLGGFDEEAFPGMTTGEDVDLAWRAIESGAAPVWSPDAVVHHAVAYLGPVKMLRRAWRWHGGMLAFKRHPGIREYMHLGIFWSVVHWWLVRALIALALPRRLWWLRLWLAAPYVRRLVLRRTGPLLAPWLITHDLVEMAACARGGLRHRVLVL